MENFVTKDMLENKLHIFKTELETERRQRLKSQQDVFFKKDTGELFAAKFLGDKVRLISTGGNVAAVESILNSQGVKDFRNMLIDMLGMDEGLKW